MPTVLIYTSPARGHLYPVMDVALALRRRGHDVVVQTLSDAADVVRDAGLSHRAIHPGIEARPLDDHQAGNPLAQLSRTTACWLARAPLEVEDLRAARAELDPDLLLVDANSWGAGAFAESETAVGGRRPWAMFLPYCLPVPDPKAPAFGPGFPPPRGWPGRLRDALVWQLQGLATRSAVSGLNALRADLGIGPVDGIPDLFDRPDLLLYRTAESFDYARAAWPAPLHQLGPGLWAPPAQAPAWLSELPRPIRLVTVSTELQEDGAIIEAALAAFADAPGSVVVTTAALDPARFAAPHDRVRITRFLPHAQVIPHVDLVVTHGGMGTTQRALAAGVPVCVVPWGRDQSETARRVVHSGAGTTVARARLSPQRLRTAADEALACGDGAARVARAFAAAGGGERGATLLEGLLSAERAAGDAA